MNHDEGKVRAVRHSRVRIRLCIATLTIAAALLAGCGLVQTQDNILVDAMKQTGQQWPVDLQGRKLALDGNYGVFVYANRVEAQFVRLKADGLTAVGNPQLYSYPVESAFQRYGKYLKRLLRTSQYDAERVLWVHIDISYVEVRQSCMGAPGTAVKSTFVTPQRSTKHHLLVSVSYETCNGRVIAPKLMRAPPQR